MIGYVKDICRVCRGDGCELCRNKGEVVRWTDRMEDWSDERWLHGEEDNIPHHAEADSGRPIA